MIQKLITILQLQPIQIVINYLIKNEYLRIPFSALEVFGSVGKKISYYAKNTSNLEIWEIDAECQSALQQCFPKATIKITDSFSEVKNKPIPFDLIVIDNSMSVYGDKNEYCEHFGLFPDIFEWSKSGTIFIINVIVKKTSLSQKKYPYLFNIQHKKFRSEFYHTTRPECLDFEVISSTYKTLGSERNRQIGWIKRMKYNFFWKKDIVSYLVFQVK